MTNILLAELLEDRRFPGVVEAEHQDSSFVVGALELAEERLRVGVGSRRWRVSGGVLSTAATRRRESHGSEPAAPRAAGKLATPASRPRPVGVGPGERDVVPGGEEESSRRRRGDSATRI